MIDFSLTDENRLVRDSDREFVAAEILPNIRAWDEQGGAHPEVFAMMGELGSQLHTLVQADYALGYRVRPLRCEPVPAQGFERWPALGGGSPARGGR